MSDSEVSKGLERLAGIWDARYIPVIGVFCLWSVFDIVDRFVPQNAYQFKAYCVSGCSVE